MRIKIAVKKAKKPTPERKPLKNIPRGTVFYGDVPGVGKRLLLRCGPDSSPTLIDLGELAEGKTGTGWAYYDGGIEGYRPVKATLHIEEM